MSSGLYALRSMYNTSKYALFIRQIIFTRSNHPQGSTRPKGSSEPSQQCTPNARTATFPLHITLAPVEETLQRPSPIGLSLLNSRLLLLVPPISNILNTLTEASTFHASGGRQDGDFECTTDGRESEDGCLGGHGDDGGEEVDEDALLGKRD